VKRAAAAVAIATVLTLSACSASIERVDQAGDVGDVVTGRVVKIADGDTITVRTGDGQRRKVRLLAIDTPESYATRYGYTECGGEEAKEAMRRLVAASPRVKLTTDPSQDETDRYGRLLAYVAPATGGETFQAALTREGWAEVYRFNEQRPPRLARKLDPLAEAAKRSGAGVWRSCGGFHVRQG
jgi:micrococcal nuclease